MESISLEEKGAQQLPLEIHPEFVDKAFQGVLGLGYSRCHSMFSIEQGIVTITPISGGADSVVQIPLSLFYGVVLRPEENYENGEECVSLYIVMDDMNIAIPVYHGKNTEQLLPLWYDWQECLSLELMVSDKNGVVTQLAHNYSSLMYNEPQPRRMCPAVKARRLHATRRDHFRQTVYRPQKSEVISLSQRPSS